MMPYQHFRQMSDEDLASVIVYIRSVPPVRNQVPRTQTHISCEISDPQRARTAYRKRA